MLPIEVEEYKQCVQDRYAFREWVDAMCRQYPELFPSKFEQGCRDLTTAYAEFKTEALRLNPDYQPQTVNNDGWYQTRLAWLALFPTMIVLRCFLHAFLNIRERCKSAAVFPEVRRLVWQIYHAHAEIVADFVYVTQLSTLFKIKQFCHVRC